MTKKLYWKCRIGLHDWLYDVFVDAAGISNFRNCRKCGKHEWLW